MSANARNAGEIGARFGKYKNRPGTLQANIELGVRLRGAPARGARDLFEHMLRCGALERVAGSGEVQRGVP